MDIRLWIFLSVNIVWSFGASVEDFFPYGIGVDESLELGDDVVSEKFTLNMPIVYFGQRKYNLWVSTNGLISFDKPVEKYEGKLFPIGREVVAPFYADVDTTSTGEVFYRESTQKNDLEQAALNINRLFKPPIRYEPSSLFVATWVNVGSYNGPFEKVNTFQLVIATDGYESYATFYYLDDTLQWVQAQVKDGIAEIAAQAGFDAGSRSFSLLVLPNSGFSEAANWNKESNAGIPGAWFYKIGNVRSIKEPSASIIVEAPAPKKPENYDELCGVCSTHATCDGKCCVCNTGYYGNGVSCLDNLDLRFDGQVTGTVNEQKIDRAKMEVTIKNSKIYVATHLDPLVGYAMQVLVPMAEIMGWIYASGEGSNGFSITGGVLNYSAVITAGSEVFTLDIHFNGLTPGNKPAPVDVKVNGNLPTNAYNHQVVFSDHTSKYGHVKKGEYRAESSRTYTVNEKDYVFNLREVITFNECRKPVQISGIRHSSYYVYYNDYEPKTLFALVSQIEDTPGGPCDFHDCHYNGVCVSTSEGYDCECKQGYRGSGRECQDIDECVTGANTCSSNANCFNTDGGYRCQCQNGYTGDGYYCAFEENRLSCRDLDCGDNAQCEYRGDEPYCACNIGYKGDGYTCEPIVVTCNTAPDICDVNAECVYNSDTEKYECQCKAGFSGDGDTCDTPIDASCARCSYNAQCVYEPERRYYHCTCNSGYSGDGQTCELIDVNKEAPILTTLPPTEPIPVTPSITDPDNCYYNRDLCDTYASCIPQSDGSYTCVCNDGYLGTGKRCVEADCRSHSDCDENALCQYSTEYNKYMCTCNEGYEGDGILCTSTTVMTCNEVNVCHPDADCYDTMLGPKCVCRKGYIGDGNTCSPVQENCVTRPSLCDRNAVCTRTTVGDFVCICNPGYRGDGSTCTSLNEKGNYLLFSRGMSVLRVPFYQAGSERGRRILYRRGQTIVGLAADCKDRYFYFSDINSGIIGRASLDNSSDNQVIITGLKSPEGLAVDWVSRTLFWTDSVLDRIEVSDLEGQYRKVIIDTDLVNPRAIVVDPIGGRIFWTDWNRAGAKIESAKMDGSSRELVISDNLGLPNGLTFDFYRRELCWADAGTHKIECSNTDGSGRQVLYNYANYPFSVTTFRDNYYWIDWNISSIQTIPRGGEKIGASIQYPIGGNGRAYSIVPVPSQCLPGVNKCSSNNGDCKFLCLPTSSVDATCVCPDNIDEDECNKIDDSPQNTGFFSSLFG